MAIETLPNHEAVRSTLIPHAERLGQHLIHLVSEGHPMLTSPNDQFWAVEMVVDFNGNETAADLAWGILQNNSHEIRFNQDEFADALIRHDPQDGASKAYEVAQLIPVDKDPVERAYVLMRSAETTSDISLKEKAVREATDVLVDYDPANDHDFHLYEPDEIMVRLGVAGDRPDLVRNAHNFMSKSTRSFDLMRALAKGLQRVEQGTELREALVDSIMVAQSDVPVHVAQIVRNKLPQYLQEDELQLLLKMIQSNSSMPIYWKMKDSAFGSNEISLQLCNPEEAKKFGDLVTEHDAWISKRLRVRYALKTFAFKQHNRRKGYNRRKITDFYFIGHEADRVHTILNGVVDMTNPESVDSMLEYGLYQRFSQSKELRDSDENHANAMWTYGLLSDLRKSRITNNSADLMRVYDLRDALPYTSASRVALNACLFEAGDTTALVDTVESVTSKPDSVIIKTIPASAEQPQKIVHADMHPYEFEFFKLIPNPSEDNVDD